MITLAFIALIILAGYFLSKSIRKNHTILYIIFTIVSALAFFISEIPITMAFNKGFLGLAFFYVVMINGILPKKKSLYKKLYSIRAELSILGFIVLTPHAIKFFIDMFFNSGIDGIFDFVGLIAYVIMIPLFITSFKKIRAKFSFYNWKRIQNFAYFAYLLIFVHLIMNYSLPVNLILYLILFIPYIIYKPIYYFKYEKDFYKKLKKSR
ncbi:MAG: ferric reductase-like transmembrane domain-containing protein [Tenericutes bacterium]|nr:ferric reductase-like transmembrane domain-containing protein [Mycoplasmatota bacterium]